MSDSRDDSTFYNSLAPQYDEFVNWTARLAAELPFIESLLHTVPGTGGSPARVLDAACGTAMHALALTQRGYTAVAADLSPAMVDRARHNAAQAGIPLRVEQAGFGELAAALGIADSRSTVTTVASKSPRPTPTGDASDSPHHTQTAGSSGSTRTTSTIGTSDSARPTPSADTSDSPHTTPIEDASDTPLFTTAHFDAVLCLGNSLPHVSDITGLARALSDFAACLRPGGLLLLQNRNFDAVLAARQRWMEPQAHRAADTEKIFIRFYDFDPDGRITFNMLTLQRQGESGWSQQVTATRLLPLTQYGLSNALVDAGFHRLQAYGSLAGDPFDPATSPNLVICAYQ